MPKEIIIDFCKTADDALGVISRREDDYKLSFRLNNVGLIDFYLAMDNAQELIETTPDVNDHIIYYQIMIWTLEV